LISFVGRTPLLLGAWTLAFPALAVLLAAAADYRIRVSEGTRSGAELASAAWKIALLVGVPYLTYLAILYWTISYQAETFTRDFFDKLKTGEINAAFQLTRKPAERGEVNPHDEAAMMLRYGLPEGTGRGPLVNFRRHEMVRLVSQGGSDVLIEPKGIREWDYDRTSYHVKQIVRLKTPEGEFPAMVTVQSSEAGGSRRWQVIWTDSATQLLGPPKLSEHGKMIQTLRIEARQFVAEWLERRQRLDSVGAFLDTQDPTTRGTTIDDLLKKLAARVEGAAFLQATQPTPLARLVHALANSELGEADLPGYKEFLEGSYLVGDKPAGDDALKPEAIADVRGLFRQLGQCIVQLVEGLGHPTPLANQPGAFRVAQDVDVVAVPGPNRLPRYRCEARVLVEVTPNPKRKDEPFLYRIVGVDLVRVSPPPPPPPDRDGPGPMGGLP
jgi:hypothetical protein